MSDRIRLTSRSLEDLKPRPSRYIAWDKDHRGFGVRITPQGTKTFVYVYRFDGASRLLSIGNTPPLTLEEARATFAEAQAKVMRAKHQRRHECISPSEELDPAAAKRKRRQERIDCPTGDDLFALYERKSGPSLRPTTRYENGRIWRTYVKPALGGVKASDVQPHAVKRLLDHIHDNSGPAMANRVHGFVATLFNLARRELLIDFESPTRRVRRPGKEAPRNRALNDTEIRGLFAALPKSALSVRVRMILQLVLVTGVRPGEACAMRWQDVDEAARTWIVPAGFVKTKKPHCVPLSPLALEWIGECRGLRFDDIWVFPAARGGRAFATNNLSNSLRDEATIAPLREQKVEVFTPHDLRRSCRTGLARLGVPRHIAEAVIGHEHRRGIERTYDQYDLLDERRHALERWGAHLEALRAGPNVLQMKTAA